MDIRVRPEGREDVYLVEKKDIIKWLKKYREKKIHNFIGAGPMAIGADWDKGSVIEKIKRSDRIAILTGEALKGNLRHALSVIAKNKLYMFDIGEITETDLDIIMEE